MLSLKSLAGQRFVQQLQWANQMVSTQKTLQHFSGSMQRRQSFQNVSIMACTMTFMTGKLQCVHNEAQKFLLHDQLLRAWADLNAANMHDEDIAV
jgi:uncharacterized membrane protein YoaK (UPF0700 family)